MSVVTFVGGDGTVLPFTEIRLGVNLLIEQHLGEG
jgi:hypothetical protein